MSDVSRRGGQLTIARQFTGGYASNKASRPVGVRLNDNPTANVFSQFTGDLLHYGFSVGGGQPIACTVTAVVFDSKNNEWVANSAGVVYLSTNFGSFKHIITLS
jgi:hypothetical protein